MPKKNLTLHRDKCELNKSELRYMGHNLSDEGLKIDANKVKAVSETKEPTNVRCSETSNYQYRCFGILQ